MSFKKIQKLVAIAMAATLIVQPAGDVTAFSNSFAVKAESAQRTSDIDELQSTDDGVFKVTMDDTGYITADNDNVSANVDTPFSWDNVNVYFVLTDRFYNGDEGNDHAYGRSEGEKESADYKNRTGTFHGGDLAGLTKKLEDGYFDELGTNAIWITAPYEQIHGGLCADKFKHYAYHGYYALDYTNVDGNMGKEEELEKFIDTAHTHGIRVVFDIVMNHAGYADAKTADDYGFGKLADNWKQIYYETSEKEYQWYNDYVGEASKKGSSGMMDASGDWQKNWWGSNWVRAIGERFSGYQGNEQDSDELKKCLDGLPDFKTETTNDPELPGILKVKWGKEGTLDAKTKATEENMSKRGLSKTVTGYIATWLSDWVEKYGVDGFRCDTAKHVSQSEWGKLKSACSIALKNWRKANPDKPGAKWTDDFWMTGEHWGHGVGKDGYYSTGGFDSMINFDYQCNYNKKPQEMDSIYSQYASKINSDSGFNVLSYISSHDTPSTRTDNYKYSLLSAKDGGTSGISLLLLPGGVQTYYGDESGREEWKTPSGCTGDQIVRSDMNWSNMDNARLTVWQKVGRFRRNHIAVGAGQHKKLDGDNYTFSRIYEGKATVGAEAVTDYKDAVVVCLPGKATTTDVKVGDTFGDATTVRDAYSGETYEISGGVVSGVKCDSKGVILLEVPTDGTSTSASSVSASPSGSTYKEDTVEVTLKAKDATDTYYQIGDGEKVAYKDGDKITIGGDTAYEEETVIKLTGKGKDKDGKDTDLSKELKFTRDKEPEIGAEGGAFCVRVKKSDFDAAPQIYVYDDTHKWTEEGDTAYTGAWPGKTMTEEGDYYVYKNDEITTPVMAIVFTADESWRSTPDLVDPDPVSGTVELNKGASSSTFEKVTVSTGDKCKVTINYIDKTTDKKLKTIYRVGAEGDEYKTYEANLKDKTFAGYQLAEKPENATGKFTKDEITVNYYYIQGDATPVPSETPTTDVATPTPEVPTAVPSEVPTADPATPTPEVPTAVPTETPTENPATPTPEVPTAVPSEVPATDVPASEVPATLVPTLEPTKAPVAFKATLKASPANKTFTGKTVKFTVGAKGGSGSYKYKVVAENSAGTMTTLQSYKANKTISWKPKKAGTYTITVWARDTKTKKTTANEITYKVVNQDLVVSKFTVTKAGKKAIKLTAKAKGGVKVTYKFTVKVGNKKEISLTKFIKKNTFTWKKAARKKKYTFYVYVVSKDAKKTTYKLKKKFTLK